MSRETRPISPASFRLAIKDLPVGNLYGKASELQNSIDHLKSSNAELSQYPDDGDLRQALTENEEVIQRMSDRILMLKAEAEKRGLRWAAEEGYSEGTLEPGECPPSASNMTGTGSRSGTTRSTAAPSTNGALPHSGRLSDDQLRRMLAERLGGEDDEDEDGEGVHL